jgi:hypothetical protein
MQKQRPEVSPQLYIVGVVFLLVFLFIPVAIENWTDIRLQRHRRGGPPISMMWWFATIPVASGVAAFLFARHRQIARHGIDIEAEITGIGAIAVSGMKDLSFKYTVENATYSQTTSVPQKCADALSIGGHLAILVLPKSPNRYMILWSQFAASAGSEQ